MEKIVINGIEIKTIYKQKKIKNIIIRISNGVINLSFPMNCSNDNAKEFLLKHKEWIRKNYKPKEQDIFEKEEVKIFDKIYKLKTDTNQVQKFTIQGDLISVKKRDENLIFDFFKNDFIKIFDEVKGKFQKNLKQEPKIVFRFMKSKWGSCNFKKYVITINKNLLYHDKEYLNYVMHHEFAHFIVPNHSKEFYKELKRYYPNFEDINKKIKRIGGNKNAKN